MLFEDNLTLNWAVAEDCVVGQYDGYQDDPVPWLQLMSRHGSFMGKCELCELIEPKTRKIVHIIHVF